MILFILYGIILILFYYHDKNILTGAAYETAAVAARKNSMEPPFQEEDIEKLLKERISGKMIFFRGAEYNQNVRTIMCGFQYKHREI